MQTKTILIAVVIGVVFALMSWRRPRTGTQPPLASPSQISVADLNEGERHVYDLLREVHGRAVLTELFVREEGNVRVQLTLDTNKVNVSNLNINLSSLARKQKNDGLSDGAVKRGFTF